MPLLVPPAVLPGILGEGPQPTLTGDGVVVRPWQKSDAPALVAAYADPAIRRWHVRTMDGSEARDWVTERRLRWTDGRAVDWAVTTDDDEVLGRVAFRGVKPFDGEAEISYWVSPAARGRGVAPVAVRTACAWMFSTGVFRVILTHSVHNAASCRVAGKTGFTLEGTCRQQVRHEDGRHDMHLHARLATDL